MLSEPIVAQTTLFNPVDKFGKFMGTFFFFFSLWLASMLVTFAIHRATRSLQWLRYPVGVIIGRFAMGLVGAAVVALFGLGFLELLGFTTLASAGEAYGFMILVLIAFSAVNQGLLTLLDFGAIVVAGPLLPLQVAAGGAMLPSVLTPDFYQALRPFLPMTYGIEGLRHLAFGDLPVGDEAMALLYITAISLAAALILCPVAPFVRQRFMARRAGPTQAQASAAR